MAFLRGPVRVFGCSADASSRIDGPEGVKEVRNPKYGVLLGAVGCVLGYRGWK